ncbi:MAG: ABC transporter substrate-binding protein [Deltaproteobacteria bacterium]|nr:ABC transporter substrate-binding protein [Deltaproteobacteria bacterium]
MRRIFVTTLFFSVLIFSFHLRAEYHKVIIQLPWYVSVEFSGPLLAKELGLDKKHGVVFEFLQYAPNVDLIETVISGKADMGITDGSSIIINRAKGKNITAIWAQMQTSPVGVCTLEDSGIQAISDIVGKKFGIQKDYEYLLDVFLSNASIPKNKIHLVYIEGDPVIPLESRRVDAVGCFDTYQPPIMMIRGHKPKIIRSDELGFNFYEQVFFVSSEKLNQNRQYLVSALRAIKEGWVYAFAHNDEAVKIVTTSYGTFNPNEGLLKDQNDHTRHQSAVIKLIRWYMTKGVGSRLGMMRMQRWQDSIAILKRNGLVDVAPELHKLFTPSFVE